LIYISLIAGVGSSIFLKRYLQQATSREYDGLEADFNQIDYEIDYGKKPKVGEEKANENSN
jgi:hypothetical protein